VPVDVFTGGGGEERVDVDKRIATWYARHDDIRSYLPLGVIRKYFKFELLSCWDGDVVQLKEPSVGRGLGKAKLRPLNPIINNKFVHCSFFVQSSKKAQTCYLE